MRCTFYSALAFAAILAKQIKAIAAEEESLENINDDKSLAQLQTEENWLDLPAAEEQDLAEINASSSDSDDFAQINAGIAAEHGEDYDE